jgi:hypothetical protein
MLIIPPTQEVAIKRMMVRSQLRQKVRETPCSNRPVVVVQVYNPSHTGDISCWITVGCQSQAKTHSRPYLKNN